MKVLLINGSPHSNGNTADALNYLAQNLEANGLETETLWIGNKPVQGCIGCYKCMELGRCVFTDELYERTRRAISNADAIVIGSPT
ncbi:MAG: flavodoxin family protein, partial [Muribaculaceae bacterium]|nr:flavodoxin family protein [Muribaculaceae bacterium]